MAKQKSKSKYQTYIDIINDLFIMRRDTYLEQLQDGSYITHHSDTPYTPKLNDKLIEEHLKHNNTYGILMKKSTKFMMFDIDGNGIENASHIKRLLVGQLIDSGFEYEYIHTEFSGKKGYHVYIFFEQLQDVAAINHLQNIMRMKITQNEHYDRNWGSIEIRPTLTQGIKLPLGIHWGTNQICWFCDQNDNTIKTFDYLVTIKKFPKDKMTKVFQKIKKDNNTYHLLSKEIKGESPANHGISKITFSEGKEAFENGILLPHTRHNTLFSAALYLKACGKSKEECHRELTSWMDKQNPKVISTPKYKWQDDVDRVVGDIYSGKYTGHRTKRKNNLYVTREVIGYIYDNRHTKNKCQRIILLLMALNQMRFSDNLEDGGFRYSKTQIVKSANVSEDSARRIPLQLAAKGLIRRQTGKPSNNPIIKAGSLFGNPPIWFKLNDDLLNLIYQAKKKADKKDEAVIEIDSDIDLYEQMNYALHMLFEIWEITKFLKKDAFKTSLLDYQAFCLKHQDINCDKFSHRIS